MRRPARTIQHLKRYREIAQVFIHHGFGELVDAVGLLPYLSLPQRLLHRGRPVAPPLGMPQRLRLALEELGPTFIKLGQVLSTRPDILPPAYIAELAKLQDTVPPVPWGAIRTQIDAELSVPLEEQFIDFEPVPIAAASLSQVHAATLPDGTQVVVKVQRPHIQTIIETDLEILFDLARLIQERTPLGKTYDLPEIVDEFAITLRAELDFYREGRNADRFRANFANEPYLHIPRVYWDFTTRRMLVLERISGIKIDDIEALDAAGYDRSRIGLHAAHMIIKEVLDDGFFHADPHPGNFAIMPGEIIGAMDFGMVGHLSHRVRSDLIRLYIVAVQLDEEGIVDQLIHMGAVSGALDRAGLQRDATRLLRKYHGMPLGTIRAREVVEDVMPIAFRHNLRLPSDLWLLGKTTAMMEGVGLKLVPDFDIFAVSEPYVRRFMWQMTSPRTWGPPLLKGASDWAELMRIIPRVSSQVLTRVERGEFEITLSHKELGQALVRLDRLANRLSLSMLLAALIVGLALLVPAFNLAGQWSLATIVSITGFAGASLLGLWLIFSIWRSGRRR
ncbi:MAG: AarF/ABC1/UbiB kinase family protein [Anaerolineae bacterium]|nr:AarF/ABC1/UbiB kinase family protein [Anaerolineae bacterium]